MIVTRTDYGIMQANNTLDNRQGLAIPVKGECVLEENHENDQRNFHRFARAQAVRIQFKDPSQFGGSLSCDLSEGGARIHLSDFVPVNTELTLSIQLADESVVECPCRIAWVEKNRFSDSYQAGLEFINEDLIMNSRKKIHGFLSSQV